MKLCNGVVTNPHHLAELRAYVREQMAYATGMDPHMRLDFFKMTVRTKALQLMAQKRKQQNLRLAELELDIGTNTALLATHTDQDSRDILMNNLERDKLEVEGILQEQGSDLAHKARTMWYNEGEKSNKYFLNLLKRNGERNEMGCLVKGNDVIDTAAGIRAEVTEYYSQIYNNGMEITVDGDFLTHMFEVDNEHQQSIAAPITLEELWAALKSVRATTPGPDGISNMYLKRLWDIAGPLVLEAWNYSLATNNLAPSHKTSLLRLIPKAGKDITQLKNWRPITLSNCDHKLITRVYNNRGLRAIGPHITPTQTAYIKGRNIADNLRCWGQPLDLRK